MGKTEGHTLLYMAAGAALLPVLLLRDFTPSNELRYLSIADEALRNHTFFTFTNHGVPYTDKPPLYLWVVMLCRWLTGSHRMWLLSLFSLLPAWGVMRTMDAWTAGVADDGRRASARLMLLTCALFLGSAVTLRMDMLMSFFIVLSLREFWAMQGGGSRAGRSRWLFPLYLFLAVFTKGPLGLLVPLCGTAAFLAARRRVREFFRYWGWRTWGVLLACCALWFTAVYAEAGSGYLHDLLFKQTAGRAVSSFTHAAPFYYYAVCVWYCLAPWAFLVVGTVAAALRPGGARGDLQCFFLSVGTAAFALLSCISSKLQVYLLPAVPFLVYGAAMSLPRLRANRWARAAVAIPAAAFSLALPALAVAATAMREEVPYLGDTLFYAAAAILTVCGARASYLSCDGRRADGLAGSIRCLGAGLLLSLFVGGWAMPELNPHIGYGALCRTASELARERGIADIRTWHLPRSENVDVYLRRPVKVVEGEEPPAPDGKPYLLLTRARNLSSFPGREARTAGPYAVIVCTE